MIGKPILGFLIVLILAVGAAPAVHATEPFTAINAVWGSNTAPVQVGPGSVGAPLTINMEYGGFETVTLMTALLFLPAGISNMSGSQVATAKAANVNPDATFTLLYALNIANSLRVGEYSLPMTITYYTPSTGFTGALSASLGVTVSINGKVSLIFSSPVVTLSPGRVNTVPVLINNTGTGEASQLSLSASAPMGISILNTFPTIPSLGSGSWTTQTMSVFVPSSDEGFAASFTLTATYTDAYGNPQTATQTVGYYVAIVQSDISIVGVPQTLTGNALNSIALSVTNTGNSTVTHALLLISSQATATIIGSDGKFSLGTLNPGDVAERRVSLFVTSSSPSTLSLQATVTYNDASGTPVTVSREVSFFVSQALTNYTIGASTRSLVVGMYTAVKLTFDNTGSTPINSMVVTLVGQQPLAVISGGSEYNVGTLAAGASAAIQTTLYVGSASSQFVSLTLSISYRDASGTPFTDSRTMNFVVASPTASFVILNTAWQTPSTSITTINGTSISSSPIEVGPGTTDAPLSITLQYFGNATVESLHAVLTLPSVFTDQQGAHTALAYTTGIPPNSIFMLSFPLDVATNASIVDYSFPLRLSWNTTVASGGALDLSTVVPLDGKTDISVSTTSSGLYPGKVNGVNLEITNVGTGALTQLKVVPTLAGGSLVNQIAEIQEVTAGSTITAPLKIFAPQSSAGLPIVLSLTMSYYDAYGDSRTASATVGLFVESSANVLSPLAISVTPSTLIAGQMNNVTVGVTNTGSLPLNNLSITFGFEDTGLTWISPAILQLTRMAPGQNMTIPARVFVDSSAPDSNLLQLSVKYFDSNNNLNQETRSFGLLSKGVVELLLEDATTIPQQPSAGQIFSITGTITNIGTTTAVGVFATAEVPEGFKIFGSQSVFIGDVPVNTPTTFTITMSASSSARPGSYNIPMQLTYLNNLREKITDTVTTPVVISSSSANGTQTGSTGSGAGQGGGSIISRPLVLGLIAIVIAVAALGAGFWIGRRRASRK